jgi:hypothetical protein
MLFSNKDKQLQCTNPASFVMLLSPKRISSFIMQLSPYEREAVGINL